MERLLSFTPDIARMPWLRLPLTVVLHGLALWGFADLLELLRAPE